MNSTTETYDTKKETKEPKENVEPKEKPTRKPKKYRPHPVIPPKLKKPTQMDTELYKKGIVQETKDKYKIEMKSILKERVQHVKATNQLDTNIKTLKEKMKEM